MVSFPDHPIIQNLERTGEPDGREPIYPRCPICGEECETVYSNRTGIVGCDVCIKEADAWEESKCFPDEELRGERDE